MSIFIGTILFLIIILSSIREREQMADNSFHVTMAELMAMKDTLADSLKAGDFSTTFRHKREARMDLFNEITTRLNEIVIEVEG